MKGWPQKVCLLGCSLHLIKKNVGKTIRPITHDKRRTWILITQDKKRTWIRLITHDKKRTWIRLITQDKKRTWICEIKLIFVPSCSRVRRQLRDLCVVCKMWSIFQQLSSISSFRKTRWRQLNLSESRNNQWVQQLKQIRAQKRPQGLCQNIFTACRRRRPRLFFLSSLWYNNKRRVVLHATKINDNETPHWRNLPCFFIPAKQHFDVVACLKEGPAL